MDKLSFRQRLGLAGLIILALILSIYVAVWREPSWSEKLQEAKAFHLKYDGMTAEEAERAALADISSVISDADRAAYHAKQVKQYDDTRELSKAVCKDQPGWC